MAKRKPKIRPIFWTSIDEMPVYCWWKLNETGDPRWLFHLDVKGYTKAEKLASLENFQNLRDEYINYFGISQEQKMLMQHQRELALMRIKFHRTGDRKLITFMLIKEQEIEVLQREMKGSGQSPWETKAHVEKWMGIRINPKETSVKEYYTYVDIIKKQPVKTVPSRG